VFFERLMPSNKFSVNNCYTLVSTRKALLFGLAMGTNHKWTGELNRKNDESLSICLQKLILDDEAEIHQLQN
jgi:hypothetical protein